jgi:hypothetical protein
MNRITSVMLLGAFILGNACFAGDSLTEEKLQQGSILESSTVGSLLEADSNSGSTNSEEDEEEEVVNETL